MLPYGSLRSALTVQDDLALNLFLEKRKNDLWNVVFIDFGEAKIYSKEYLKLIRFLSCHQFQDNSKSFYMCILIGCSYRYQLMYNFFFSGVSSNLGWVQNIITRIMGLLMAAIGIEFMASGVKMLFPVLESIIKVWLILKVKKFFQFIKPVIKNLFHLIADKSLKNNIAQKSHVHGNTHLVLH